MKREDILNEMLSTFASFNRAKAVLDFQFYLKGENFLLSYLQQIGGESTPSKLAEVLDVSPARVAAILRSLERKKLLVRVTDCKDKRRVSVKITQKGIEWVELAGSEMYKQALNIFDKLGEDDTRELVRIVKKMMWMENGEKTEKPKEEALPQEDFGKEEKNEQTENNSNEGKMG